MGHYRRIQWSTKSDTILIPMNINVLHIKALTIIYQENQEMAERGTMTRD